MKLSRNQIILLVVLAVVALLAVFAPKGEDAATAVVEPVARKGAQAEGAPSRPSDSSQQLALASTPRGPLAEGPLDLFNSTSWYVPPPPPPPAEAGPPAPPPVPTAPPLPFSFMGRYDDGTTPIFLLARGDLVVTASIGDKIDNTYLVDSLQGRALVINYLPLNQKQTLDVGAPQ